MKIYHDIEIPQTEPVIQDLATLVTSLQGELFKLKMMWALRHLENEIIKEGGMIIIKQNGQVLIKEFTAELTAKIKTILGATNWVHD
ncbi:hypothetical protein [Chitinophaga sp. sic0106]|uniref:hypothetical protein n=1 Tax=Chitinophaga sp. sic0106 TaxID=2854785 RepID=UPI001C44A333|nr:hypothetical protein [Chitinophaga sp. sic0106]MBV7531132.1 hypothetical protein [Chitinophaga sp. sic0106]